MTANGGAEGERLMAQPADVRPSSWWSKSTSMFGRKAQRATSLEDGVDTPNNNSSAQRRSVKGVFPLADDKVGPNQKEDIELVSGGEPAPEEGDPTKALWRAVKNGDIKRIKQSLHDGAKFDMDGDELRGHPDCLSLEYKSRKFLCNPLHYAAFFEASTPVRSIESEGSRLANEMVKVLLEAKSDLEAYAWTEADTGGKRGLQAVHLAAGAGNAAALDTLLREHANANAWAKIDNGATGMVDFYKPIHDAAWFNCLNSVSTLIKHKADICAINNQRETAMHIAASNGYASLMEVFVDTTSKEEKELGGRRLSTTSSISDLAAHRETLVRLVSHGAKMMTLKDRFDRTPLDCAVEKQRFPERSLHLFTQNMTKEDRVDAFVKVARRCPAAASALLRSMPSSEHDLEEESEHISLEIQSLMPIDSKWRESLAWGASEGLFDISLLTFLLEDAPPAAVDLIEALTDVPEVTDPQHHPLPIRARIPKKMNPYSISSVYEHEVAWTWDPEKAAQTKYGGMDWHDKLAPSRDAADQKFGKEVQIRVMKLKGLANLELLHALAHTDENKIFTKLIIHALLDFVWSNFRIMFISDLIHEALVLIVISAWIYGFRDLDSQPHEMIKITLWSCLASQGMAELVMILVCAFRCFTNLGGRRMARWLKINWPRCLNGFSTTCLAAYTSGDCWPDEDAGMLLAINSLLHWMLFLYDLRAFQWTGQKILPIMKSVQPIAGMVVIIMFLLVAFCQAFWAMDTNKDDDVSFYDVAVLLFTGESFISGEDIATMDGARRPFMIALTILSLFLFMACALNVFIAVLGDCYDQEQERMIRTFQLTRAEICSTLYLRPSLQLGRLSASSGKDNDEGKDVRKRCPTISNDVQKMLNSIALSLLITAICSVVILVLLSVSLWWGLSVWIPTLAIVVLVFTLQGLLRGGAGTDWSQRYMWLSHESALEEDMFLAPDERDAIESTGRISRIKKYVLEQKKELSAQCNSIRRAVHASKKQLEEKIEDIKANVDEKIEEKKQFDSTANSVSSRWSQLAGALECANSEAARGDHSDLHVKDEERSQTKASTVQTVSVEHQEREVDGVKQDLSGMKRDLSQIRGRSQSKAATLQTVSVEYLERDVEDVKRDLNGVKQDLSQLQERSQTKAATLQTGFVDYLEREVEGVKRDLSGVKEDLRQLQDHVGSIDSKLDRVISIMERADERRKRKKDERKSQDELRLPELQ